MYILGWLIRGPSRHIYENKFYEDDDELLIHQYLYCYGEDKADKIILILKKNG